MYVHLSAGDLLRAARQSGSAQGLIIDEYICEGKIVPVEVSVRTRTLCGAVPRGEGAGGRGCTNQPLPSGCS